MKHPMIIASKITMDYRRNTQFQYAAYTNKFIKAIKDKKFPLRIEFKLVRATKRRFDYINILQVVCDMMVESRWIPDDSAAYLIPVIKEYEVDKSNAGVQITIL